MAPNLAFLEIKHVLNDMTVLYGRHHLTVSFPKLWFSGLTFQWAPLRWFQLYVQFWSRFPMIVVGKALGLLLSVLVDGIKINLSSLAFPLRYYAFKYVPKKVPPFSTVRRSPQLCPIYYGIFVGWCQISLLSLAPIWLITHGSLLEPLVKSIYIHLQL